MSPHECLIDDVGGVGLHARKDMLVHVQCEAGSCMA